MNAILKAATRDERPERVCTLIEWRPWGVGNSSLVGHASVRFSGGWCIHKVPIFRKGDGSLSAGTPSIPVLDGAGTIKQLDGKKQYSPLLTFETSAARERWQQSILQALSQGGIGDQELPL